MRFTGRDRRVDGHGDIGSRRRADMRVSVVICGYTMERLALFNATVDSVLAQRHDLVEVIIVIDCNPKLYERTVDRFGDVEAIRVEAHAQNQGISASRISRGARQYLD